MSLTFEPDVTKKRVLTMVNDQLIMITMNESEKEFPPFEIAGKLLEQTDVLRTHHGDFDFEKLSEGDYTFEEFNVEEAMEVYIDPLMKAAVGNQL